MALRIDCEWSDVQQHRRRLAGEHIHTGDGSSGEETAFQASTHHRRPLKPQRNYLLNSAPISKQNFLRCYSHAPRHALRPHAIKSGWKATGMWPVNVPKPLMSQFIYTPAPTDVPRVPAWHSRPTNDKQTPEGITIKTLKNSANLHQTRWLFGHRLRSTAWGDRPVDPTVRILFFKKLGKTLDLNNMAAADDQQVIQSLEAQLEKYKPIKRGKVKPKPNARFVAIEDIQKKKWEVQKCPTKSKIVSIDSESSDDEEGISSCIILAKP
ncbi:transposase [Colletotrichum chrysophilum]|uniref:Transposase n=1 Tax=Colletotrichum chrysophilum TaxID=1836956 RepID=A0AAD9E5B0_9PEZI|nr:transposase [Colletotrichum chrysophilum]